MTDERYTRLKQKLVDHRRRLQRSLSVRLNEVRAHNHDDKVVEALDAAEASASDLEQDFGIALAEMAAQALRHVDQALARLESGGYGSCVDCNEKIFSRAPDGAAFCAALSSVRGTARDRREASASALSGERQFVTSVRRGRVRGDLTVLVRNPVCEWSGVGRSTFGRIPTSGEMTYP